MDIVGIAYLYVIIFRVMDKMSLIKIKYSILVVMLIALSGCGEKNKKDNAIDAMQPVIVVTTDSDYVISVDNMDSDEPQEETQSDTVEEANDFEYIYDDVNKIYSKEAKNLDEIVLRFAGDTCFYDDFSLMSVFRDNGSDIDNCIDASLLGYMRDADIFMINNEFCYSDRGAPTAGKKYAFRSKPSNVEILNDMGADIVSLANNHAYDWGPDALSDTVDVLNGAKIPFVGAGKDIYEAMRPAYFKINGITISFVSATQIERLGNPDTKEATETSPGVLRTLDPTKACKVISEAKSNSDFCVMYVHWGSENTDLVEASQRDLAKKYVEAGVDLIIGDHSHCLQGIDYIDEVPVFYSMSNYWFNSKTVDTGLSEVVINSDDAKIKSVKFIPAIQSGCKTHEVGAEEQVRILSYLQGISDYAEVDLVTGEVSKSDINHNTQGGMNTSPTKKSEEQLQEDAAAIQEQIGENTND